MAGTDATGEPGEAHRPAQDGAGAGGVRTNTAPGEARAGHLGFVAHEIRNPLATALWTAELLSRMEGAERGGARGEKLAAMCLRALRRVRSLVEDHLLAERLDAGRYPVRAEPTPLAEALVAAEGRRAPGGRTSAIGGAASLIVHADRALLSRALDALLAVAGEGEGTVHVEGSAAGAEVAILVRGAPVEEGALADPSRGSPSDPRGLALALPAARRAAEHMGGRLSVRDGALLLVLPGGPLDGGAAGG